MAKKADFNKSIEYYQKAIEAQPDRLELYKNLIKIYEYLAQSQVEQQERLADCKKELRDKNIESIIALIILIIMTLVLCLSLLFVGLLPIIPEPWFDYSIDHYPFHYLPALLAIIVLLLSPPAWYVRQCYREKLSLQKRVEQIKITHMSDKERRDLAAGLHVLHLQNESDDDLSPILLPFVKSNLGDYKFK